MNAVIYFWGSVLILAALLYIPTTKLIWVMSIRRAQKKLQRELSEAELQGQMQRARFITVFLVLLFSFLFNFNLLGMPGHG
ncbi:MAG: hypothetical protein EP297_07420 [Gammaproteobacteria bacterium]|nr:MAG: hypothetical protein EP297_07420 [Gammaproteobacteria bacterium]